jgi:tRNA uridine 5-carboxymethylaminomethyl modification enzyme
MLREDNADLRLTEAGRRLGLIDDARWAAFSHKRDAVARELDRLKTSYVSTGFQQKQRMSDVLRRPEIRYADLVNAGEVAADVAEQVEIQLKYEGYIERQREEVARRQGMEELRLPPELDYGAVRGLSAEVQHKLTQHRPQSVGQAARISGVTPAAISLLLVHLKRGFRPQEKKSA